MRLIDADELEKEFCSGCQYENNKYSNCIDCALANAPTIEERKMGEWQIGKDKYGVYGECSVCKMRQYAGIMNFCPNCGADMRK